jgi:hypothetical protein
MPEIVREIFLKRLQKLFFFKDLMAEYTKYTNQATFKDKCHLLLKSSTQSMVSLERIYHNNMILTQSGYKSVCRKKPSAKNYFGSELFVVMEDSTTQPLCRQPESKQRRQHKRSIHGFRTNSHINQLIAENINYLRVITDRIRKEYNIKNVNHKTLTNIHFLKKNLILSNETQIQEEWKMLAYVLDRLLLYFFSIAFVIGFSCVFISTPDNFYNVKNIDYVKVCEF